MTKVNFVPLNNISVKFSDLRSNQFFMFDDELWIHITQWDNQVFNAIQLSPQPGLKGRFVSEKVIPVRELNMEIVSYGQD